MVELLANNFEGNEIFTFKTKNGQQVTITFNDDENYTYVIIENVKSVRTLEHNKNAKQARIGIFSESTNKEK